MKSAARSPANSNAIPVLSDKITDVEALFTNELIDENNALDEEKYARKRAISKFLSA